ncbi:hypothetical protein EAO76_05770 [Streptomyces sp. sk2.1]|nr:hypothetical protein EAO76_05770 [Streptomyces sp. sk2.1]
MVWVTVGLIGKAGCETPSRRGAGSALPVMGTEGSAGRFTADVHFSRRFLPQSGRIRYHELIDERG